MSEKHKLHNVRLDDEVWAAVKAMECSLNQYLRTALLDHPLTAESMIKLAAPAERADPRSIPGVSVGLPVKNSPVQIPSKCIHNAPHPQGREFMAERKGLTMCQECFLDGHRGEPRDCRECSLGEGTGAI